METITSILRTVPPYILLLLGFGGVVTLGLLRLLSMLEGTL